MKKAVLTQVKLVEGNYVSQGNGFVVTSDNESMLQRKIHAFTKGYTYKVDYFKENNLYTQPFKSVIINEDAIETIQLTEEVNEEQEIDEMQGNQSFEKTRKNADYGNEDRMRKFYKKLKSKGKADKYKVNRKLKDKNRVWNDD